MIDGILNFLGSRAKSLSYVLAALVVANVCLQFYTHKTTSLTPWKGGGFGMYTETHADNRSVWMEMDGQGGTVYVQLHPENPDIREWINGISLRGGAVLQSINDQAHDLRYFPNDADALALIENVARIGWLDLFTNGVAPKVGKTFAPGDIRILVVETAQNIAAQSFTRRVIFNSDLGHM